MYATVGVLFVNISIGGTLTPYAAPPVLMVADKWGLDLVTMLKTFGWKAALAVVVNAAAVAFAYRAYLSDQPTMSPALARARRAGLGGRGYTWPSSPASWFSVTTPSSSSRCSCSSSASPKPTSATRRRLMIREGLMVAFFLAGLVVLGGQQKWWLQPLLADMGPTALYFGATLLTAITDNAALTYLGSLVDGVSDDFKYSMVAGAVTGGGLTVIANAPNPAGFAILKDSFEDGSIGALGLLRQPRRRRSSLLPPSSSCQGERHDIPPVKWAQRIAADL